MLHRCSSGSHQQSIAAAPTAMASTTFSLFFPMPKPQQWPAADDEAACDDDHSSITTSPSSPSSSSTGSVDCTLSLGTPSSRRAAEPPELTKHVAHLAYSSSASWDAAAETPSYYCQGSKPAGGAAKGAVSCAAGHDPLLMDRRCANCGTTSTPLWRNGPRGPKSLCNACGIRFKKEERRAAATAAMETGAAGCGYSAQRAQYGSSAVNASPGAVSYSYGEGAFPCGGGGRDADGDAQFLAWRLNAVAPVFQVWPERTSLFQYN